LEPSSQGRRKVFKKFTKGLGFQKKKVIVIIALILAHFFII